MNEKKSFFKKKKVVVNAPKDEDSEKNNKGKPNTFIKNVFKFLVIYAVVFGIISLLVSNTADHVSSKQFFENLNDGKYSDVIVKNDITSLGMNVEYTEKDKQKKSNIILFKTDKNIDKLESASDKGLTKLALENQSNSLSIILSVIPIIFSGVFFLFIYRSFSGGGTRNEKIESAKKSTLKFSDVAGKDEEKDELMDIVNYFKDKETFVNRGIRIPRGILLEGPPGTGKTMLAKALAGEANATFYSLTGSEFNGMFRGTGTSKVKNVFKEARENAPSVIFIDEIDALARKRGGNTSITGDRDSDQTLNQLLTEMDGFSGMDEDIVVLGATNFSSSLDDALMRSGRFDRKIYVGLPNKFEREEILKLYLKSKNIHEDVDLKQLSNQIQGFSGADIESFVNEADFISYKAGHSEIESDDFDKAFNKVLVGVEKKSTVYTEEQKEIISNHESGHALVGALVSGAKTVSKVTIIPHGRAGGFALMTPTDEMFVHTKEYLQNTIITLLAGRGAEEILSNTQTTGVSQDIKEATAIAQGMVNNYAMAGSFQFTENADVKENKKLVEQILNSCYEETKKIINQNIPRIKLLSKVLQEKETLYEEEIKYIVSLPNEAILENETEVFETILSKEFKK